MYNAKAPSLDELPTSKQLLRSTIIAVITAAIILVTIVLPAEYAIDPTGIGRALNLTEMGEIKTQLAHETAPKKAVEAPVATQAATPETSVPNTEAPSGWKDETTITLARGQGAEIKLEMEGGAKATYSWVAEGGPVNFDKHGEGDNNAFASYEKKLNVTSDDGELVAEFNGMHGWFWRNRSADNVTITLRTKGEYIAVKKM